MTHPNASSADPRPFGAPEDGSTQTGRSRGRARWTELAAALAVFLFLFGVFFHSPVTRLKDSRYAILTSEAILDGDGFDLSRSLRGSPWELVPSGDPAALLPWQLARARGRLLYVFPPGTPVLTLPLVAALRAAGISTLDEEGRYSRAREGRMQVLLASFLSALTGVLILRLARHEIPLLPAAAIALVAGFGSSLWTVASHELWSQTWSALLLGAGGLELLRWEEGKKPRPLLLGAIAGAAFWVRPANAWIAIAWTVFVAFRHRRETLRLMTSGAVGLAAYWAWSLHYWGALLPRYVTMSRPWAARNFLDGLAESLFSMHHGLLVYSPILLAAGYILLRHGVPESRRPLAVLGAVLVLGHLGLHAASGADWGADGPRFQHDLVPILAWFGALALRRHRDAGADVEASAWTIRPAPALVALTLAAASILASIGSVHVGRRAQGQYRAELETSYPKWDLRRLPQYLGVRVLLGMDPPLPAPKAGRRSRSAH